MIATIALILVLPFVIPTLFYLVFLMGSLVVKLIKLPFVLLVRWWPFVVGIALAISFDFWLIAQMGK